MKFNLQFFGGRGGAGGKRTGAGSTARSNADIISSAANKAAKDWGDKYVPLSAKQEQNITKALEGFDSKAFTSQEFEREEDGGRVKRKIEGLPGQFRFIDYGPVTGGGRYEVNFLYGGVTHAAVGNTSKEAIANAQKQFKETTVREALYKKRKK